MFDDLHSSFFNFYYELTDVIANLMENLFAKAEGFFDEDPTMQD